MGRPRQVTIAGVLLLLLPLVGVTGLVVALAAMNVAQENAAGVVAELETEFGGDELPGFSESFDAKAIVDSMLSAMWLQVALISVVRLVQAVGFGILAFAVLRGSQAGRIITFVLAGLLSFGAVCLGAADGVRQRLRREVDRMGEDLGFGFVYEDDLLPGWYDPFNWAVIVASVVLILAVVWLLTRPEANEYFRRSRPFPPTPYTGQPPPGTLLSRPQPEPPGQDTVTQPPRTTGSPPPTPHRTPAASEVPLSSSDRPILPKPPGVPPLPPERRATGRWVAIVAAAIALLVGMIIAIAVMTRSTSDDTTSRFASMEGLCSKIDPSSADSLTVPLALTETEVDTDGSNATCTFAAETGDATATLSIYALLVTDADTRQAVFDTFAQRRPPVPELAERWDDSAIWSSPDILATDERVLVVTVMDGPLVLAIWSIVEGGGARSQGPTAAGLIEIAEDVRDQLER